MKEWILTDFHIHSQYSDGKHAIPELVDLYGMQGFGAIAITDHLCESQSLLGKAAAYLDRTLNELSFAHYQAQIEREAERAWKKFKMVLIPGVEYTLNSLSNHRSAHILALGLTKWVSPNPHLSLTQIPTLLKEIKNAGALTIAAHPVSNGKPLAKQTLHLWNLKEELNPLMDAWEINMGKDLLAPVLREHQSAKLPILANSDLHRVDQMESWKTWLHCERHPTAILEAIRKQNLKIEYHRPSVLIQNSNSLNLELNKLRSSGSQFAHTA